MAMRVLILFLALAFGIATPAAAFKISPFKMTLRTDTGAAGILLRLENTAPEQVAVQVRATTWDIAEDGRETNEDASADFIIFPSQLVLAKNEIRSVRLQYKGAPPQGREKAYRIIAEQLPVNLKDTPQGSAAVRLLLTFKAALYVAPGGVESGVRVAEMSRQSGNLYRIVIENEGSGHAIIRKPSLDVVLSGGARRAVSGDMLKALDGQNIQAGKRRVFVLQLPQLSGSAVDSATIKADTEY